MKSTFRTAITFLSIFIIWGFTSALPVFADEYGGEEMLLTEQAASYGDGIYTIETALSSNKVLDVKGGSKKNKANVQLYKANGTDAQQFRLINNSDGTVTFLNVKSGKALDVKGAKKASKTNVWQYKANGTAAQKWILEDAGGGYVTIRSALGGSLVLDVRGGKTANKTNIWIYKKNSSKAQKFRLVPLSEPHIVEIDPGHQRYGDSSLEPNGPGSSTMKAKVTSGTQGYATGVEEYELNLRVALKLKAELESRGYTVYLTRETHDVQISNVERALKAAEDGAEIFIRIHADGEDYSTSMYGVHGYAPANDNPYLSADLIRESQRLSALLCSYQCYATGQRNLGVLTDNTMTGINWAQMPVTIVEMGYMSNPSEDVFLNTESNQYTIAEGIANGVDAYFAGDTA